MTANPRGGGRPRQATISDVATLAGVSVPTVSRVLTGAARVSDLKREAVERAIETLRYRPSAAARALASRHPRVIAIIAGDTSRYGYAETIRGVEEEARANGYTVMITVVESRSDEHVEGALAATLAQPLAGIAVLKFDPQGVAALERLATDIPIVALSGTRTRSFTQAVLDEARAARELTAHLLSLGHRTVHHVRVPPSRREDGRTTGWRQALREADRPVPAIFDATWDARSGIDVGREIAAREEITAVLCGNDEIAMGVMRGLSDAGLRVPDDVSVAGFDDHPLAELWSPSLTTVRQDFAELGRRGLRLLMAHIGGDEARRFSSERPQVVLRQSSGPPGRG